MTDKAYIVANEQQEREVLEKLELEGITWITGRKPTEQMISSSSFTEFPYVLFSRNRLSWGFIGSLSDEEIVYDGRNEEQMSDKYVVSQEFMDKLKGWKHDLILEDAFFVNQEAINNMPKIIKNWWVDDYVTIGESNKRLISIIRYMSGANDFEVEKPKKWVVRSKDKDSDDAYWYVSVSYFMGLHKALHTFDLEFATRFDTKEEAQSWANSHQEVIEVEE